MNCRNVTMYHNKPLKRFLCEFVLGEIDNENCSLLENNSPACGPAWLISLFFENLT